MEYIVSARKYRPLNFDSVVGQSALTETLKNSVKTGKLAHAYLFCGPRGVGKTTCARIFAKVINCLNPTSEGEACEECESCKAFNEQRSFNIFELDAASNNGVEHIKSLMEQTHIPPQVGKYKVFIIDEVHMLSPAAFNAFLKTLEEPPSHVIFILATTEKHKILPTIISRCQIYDFERMTVPNIINHLKVISEKEGVTYEEEALNVIAEKADGGMRDALSVYDQAVSFCQGNLTYEKVIEDLNVLNVETYFKMVDLALANNVVEMMLLVDKTISKGFDAGQIAVGLAAHLRNVLVAKDEKTASLLQVSERNKARFIEQAAKCKPVFVYKALKILNQCDVNYRQSSNKRLLVELTLIEVAQITQPEEPGSGRGPKALKILFKYITRKRQNTVASQVATSDASVVIKDDAKKVASLSKEVGNISISQSTTTITVATKDADTTIPTTEENKNKQSTAAAIVSRLGGMPSLGPTFKTLQQTTKKTEEKKEKDVEIDEEKSFDDDKLLHAWLAMCQRIAASDVALSERLKLLDPKITEFPNVLVLVNSELLLKDIEKIKSRLLATLKKDLQNKSITLETRIAESHERKIILSPKERLEQYMENNPALQDFIDKMKLNFVG